MGAWIRGAKEDILALDQPAKALEKTSDEMKRYGQACEGCVKRHRKCDRAEPTCGGCESRRTQCTYEPLPEGSTCDHCCVEGIECDERLPKCSNCAREGKGCVYSGQLKENSPHIDKQPQACDNCHQSRRKCVKQGPRCTNCIMMGKSCISTPRRFIQASNGGLSRQRRTQTCDMCQLRKRKCVKIGSACDNCLLWGAKCTTTVGGFGQESTESRPSQESSPLTNARTKPLGVELGRNRELSLKPNRPFPHHLKNTPSPTSGSLSSPSTIARTKPLSAELKRSREVNLKPNRISPQHSKTTPFPRSGSLSSDQTSGKRKRQQSAAEEEIVAPHRKHVKSGVQSISKRGATEARKTVPLLQRTSVRPHRTERRQSVASSEDEEEAFVPRRLYVELQQNKASRAVIRSPFLATTSEHVESGIQSIYNRGATEAGKFVPTIQRTSVRSHGTKRRQSVVSSEGEEETSAPRRKYVKFQQNQASRAVIGSPVQVATGNQQQIKRHCTICRETGHNRRNCPNDPSDSEMLESNIETEADQHAGGYSTVPSEEASSNIPIDPRLARRGGGTVLGISQPQPQFFPVESQISEVDVQTDQDEPATASPATTGLKVGISRATEGTTASSPGEHQLWKYGRRMMLGGDLPRSNVYASIPIGSQLLDIYRRFGLGRRTSGSSEEADSQVWFGGPTREPASHLDPDSQDLGDLDSNAEWRSAASGRDDQEQEPPDQRWRSFFRHLDPADLDPSHWND